MIVPELRMLPVVQFGREMGHGGDLIGFEIVLSWSRYLKTLVSSHILVRLKLSNQSKILR